MIVTEDAEVLKRETGSCLTVENKARTEWHGIEPCPPAVRNLRLTMCYGNTQHTKPKNAIRLILEYSLVELNSATDCWFLCASAQSQNVPIYFTISFHPSVCLSVRQSEYSTSEKFVKNKTKRKSKFYLNVKKIRDFYMKTKYTFLAGGINSPHEYYCAKVSIFILLSVTCS
jgi:hypothetical protein